MGDGIADEILGANDANVINYPSGFGASIFGNGDGGGSSGGGAQMSEAAMLEAAIAASLAESG